MRKYILDYDGSSGPLDEEAELQEEIKLEIVERGRKRFPNNSINVDLYGYNGKGSCYFTFGARELNCPLQIHFAFKRGYMVFKYVRITDEDIKDPDKFNLYADTIAKASKFINMAIQRASSYTYTNEVKGLL